MSDYQLPPMSAFEAKVRDDRTILLASRSLRKGQPFLLAQGGNGRVIHIGGEQIAEFVDRLFYELTAAVSK